MKKPKSRRRLDRADRADHDRAVFQSIAENNDIDNWDGREPVKSFGLLPHEGGIPVMDSSIGPDSMFEDFVYPEC